MADRLRPPLARSPIRAQAPTQVLAGWEVSRHRSDAELTLADETPTAKVLVRAGADGRLAGRLGVGFGRARRDSDGTLVARFEPGAWLLLGPPNAAARLAGRWGGEEAAAAGAGGPTELVSVLDVTSGRALMRLTGSASGALLAKVCGLDLGSAADHSAFRSPVARVPSEIIRDDVPPGRRSYLLACDRSYGQYLFDALLDAGAELSIEVTGFDWEGG